MLKRIAFLLFCLIVPTILFSQDEKKTTAAPETRVKLNSSIPVMAQYSDKFKIEEYYFNRKIDVQRRGEILEVELVLSNLTDDPMELYIFTIATYEKVERTKSSFERPIPKKERIRSFVPHPDVIEEFKYENPERKGEFRLEKYPKNPKAGIDPQTGKPYVLKDTLVVRNLHLSKYRQNYFFFNNVTLLIFDSEGKPAYRQRFLIEGKRR